MRPGCTAFFVCILACFAQAGRIVNYLDHEDGKQNPRGVYQGNGKSCKFGPGCIFEVVSDISNKAIGSTRALRHKITNVDERAEIGFPNGTMVKGMDIWVVFSMYFKKGWSSGPGVICQQGGGTGASRVARAKGTTRLSCNSPMTRNGVKRDKGPPFSYLSYSGGSFIYKLYPYTGIKGNVNWWGCDTYKFKGGDDTWHTFVYHFTPDDKPHPYQVWHNGNKVIDKMVQMWEPGGSAMGNWKIGPYTGDPGKGSRLVHTDDAYFGVDYTSLDEFLDDTPYGKNPGKKPDIGGTPEPGASSDLDPAAPHIKLNFGYGTETGWVDGSSLVANANPFTFGGTVATDGVSDPAPASVYQSVMHRGESTEDVTIEWADLPDGGYTLRFHFTDFYGDRAIDVAVEGETKIEDLDPMTEAGGPMKAVVKEVAATVSGGLQITLSDNRSEPKDVFLSGLEIISKNPGLVSVSHLRHRSIEGFRHLQSPMRRYLPSGRAVGYRDFSSGIVIDRGAGPAFRRHVTD